MEGYFTVLDENMDFGPRDLSNYCLPQLYYFLKKMMLNIVHFKILFIMLDMSMEVVMYLLGMVEMNLINKFQMEYISVV